MCSLKSKADEAKANNKPLLCSLMIDEMAIRKHVEIDGNEMIGYVDLGTGIVDDTAPLATEALVFMVVCMNGSWKVPVAYFLIKGLSGSERANLVHQCISKLSDVGVTVVSLTCDGPSCHFSMVKALGASMDPETLRPNFDHPSVSGKRVHVLLDVCHMLKLVRNTLGSCGIVKDGAGEKAEWSFIQELCQLQESEGFHLGNKLRPAHVAWKSQKMKVNLAAQTFSVSVADAIDFSRDQQGTHKTRK